MASFPIFVDLGAVPPLVIGGGDLALAKSRLLLKRAPSVDVASDAPVSGLVALAEAGAIRLLPQAAAASQALKV